MLLLILVNVTYVYISNNALQMSMPFFSIIMQNLSIFVLFINVMNVYTLHLISFFLIDVHFYPNFTHSLACLLRNSMSFLWHSCASRCITLIFFTVILLTMYMIFQVHTIL
jgi:hypothetical protein